MGTFAIQDMNVIDFKISGDEIITIVIPHEYIHYTSMDLRSIARLVKGSVSGNSFKDITPPEMKYKYKEDTLTKLSAIA